MLLCDDNTALQRCCSATTMLLCDDDTALQRCCMRPVIMLMILIMLLRRRCRRERGGEIGEIGAHVLEKRLDTLVVGRKR